MKTLTRRLLTLDPSGRAVVRRAALGRQKFIIDSHIDAGGCMSNGSRKLGKIYRQHNAMACVLAQMDEFELIKKAAAGLPGRYYSLWPCYPG